MLAPTLMSVFSFAAQDPAPGIDRALAAARAARISDVNYRLQLAIEPGAGEVSGEAWIVFTLDADNDPVEPVILDFAGSALSDIRVNDRDAELVRVHNHVIVPPTLLVRGVNGITAKFESPVAPTGTPLTVYKDPADGREYYYTLVVPADAHRLFPCFDQPDLRARVRFELDIPADWEAVANTLPVEDGIEPIPNGRRWKFELSEPLPTYLMAFACGPFDVIEGPLLQAPGIDGEPLRIFMRGSQRKHLDLDALVRLHDRGLRWIADLCNVPYPFGKLDIVLCPGFPYGGMEHAGAIFYRETALVFDHPPTAAELVRRSTLVYHELSHQWFGNLVTMRWFDDLWLKEGFATFVGYLALEALEPERKAWLRFLQRVKPRAYEIDGTPGTTPVYQELQNLADAKSAYGAIVYNKAPAVLRELHDRLGPAAFRRGLTHFLETHAFGNADWRDLAASLQAASRDDLGRWSERWLLAPSMPQVRVEWTAGDDGTVSSAEVVQRAVGGDGTWPLRLELLAFLPDGDRRTIAVTTDAERAPVDALVGGPVPLAVLANPADVAYGQFVPDRASQRWLAANAVAIDDPLTRAVALSGLFEAVRETELDPARFAATALDVLAIERDPDTHGWLLGKLGTCLLRYLPAARAAPLRARATRLLLGQLGDAEVSGAELATFRFLARASAEPDVLELCRTVVAAEDLPAGLEPGKQDRFLAAAALIAAGGSREPLELLVSEYSGEDVGKERFLALAAEPTAETKAAYWQRYLRLEKPPEQWTQASLPYFHWPGQGELTLPYLRQALEKVEWVKQNRRIFFMPAWLDGFVNAHSSPAALAVVDDFLATAEISDDIRRKLLQSRDGLARAVRIRAAFGAAGPR